MSQHDESYKLFFSHPQMITDLLRGFVHESWVGELDWNTLEAVKSSFVSDNLRRREEDVIWRVRWREQWLYIYILLAFQSQVDPFMAVRVMVYLGLLYQDLIKREKLKSGDRLPPVLPIVLYNGGNRWSAAEELSNLITVVPELATYRPQLRYLLLDEGRLSEAELSSRNLVAALFRLENSRTREDIQQVLTCLLEWLEGTEQDSLRRAFTVWLKQVLLPKRLPAVSIPQLSELQEVKTMLAETVQKWYDEATAKGLMEGMAKGLTEGMAKGLTEGVAKGLAEGKAEMLISLLESKFGKLTDAQRIYLYRLDSEALLQYSSKLWTAQTLEEIIGKEGII